MDFVCNDTLWKCISFSGSKQLSWAHHGVAKIKAPMQSPTSLYISALSKCVVPHASRSAKSSWLFLQGCHLSQGPFLLEVSWISWVSLAFWTFDNFLSTVLRHSAMLEKMFSLHMDPYCTTVRRMWMYVPAFPRALS
jgi:hypothetical protein